ncbi:MAG: ABC transporter substrate-binding protein [Clostridia bacterium]|nr:ABC transporter substrate-binding protein [Clostridia bacterium]
MKKFLAVLLALSLLLCLCACRNKTDDTENGAATADTSLPDKITIALDWTPNTNHTGLYVAQEKGYFKDAGLNVEIVYLGEDVSPAQLCSLGQVQFTIDAQDTIASGFALEEPLNVTAVAALLQHNTSGIISRKGDGITSPKGMEGKIYSSWDLPVELAMLESLVTSDGGDWSKVKCIPNSVFDEPTALGEKTTDAIWVFYGWACINAEVRGFDFDYFAFRDIDPTFDYYTPILIGNNDFLAQYPEATKALLAAIGKGYQYASEHPDEAADILIASDNTGALDGAEALVKASQAWIADQYIADAPKWGYIDAARWDAFYDWLNENDLVERALPHGTGFTNDYLG